ncbi:MAG: helix-turn-helix domain-containing protein, partial [Gemmatimonadales bacterium]
DSDRVICENRGTGIPTMLAQLRRAGTASVKFSNAIGHFTVTFYREERSDLANPVPRIDEAPPGTSSAGRPAEILALFAGRSELSAADIADATGLGKAMVRRYLARLVEEGRLVATAPPASHNRTYRLSPTTTP